MRRRLAATVLSRGPARRVVLVLSLMTLLLWVGGTSIVPLLPTYLHEKGSSSALVGLVMASYFALAVITQYPVGRLSDRFGRRRVVLLGLVIFIGGSIGFATTSGALPAIAFRSLQGIGAGAVTVAGASTIAVEVAPGERGRAYAVLYGSQSLALAIGPLVGGIVGVASMRVLFLGAALFAGLGMLLVLVALSPNVGRANLGEDDGEGRGEEQVALHHAKALFGGVCVFAAAGMLGGLYESCWSLLLHSRGATSFETGLSWTLYCLPYALLSAPAGRLADRYDRRALVLGGTITSAAFALVYPELHDVALLVCIGCLEAVGAVLVTPAALSVIAEWTPARRQGAAQGALETARTASTAIGAAGCGALFGIGVFVPFAATSATLVVLALAVAHAWRLLPARRSSEAPRSAPAQL